MVELDLEQWRKDLRATFPIFGTRKRRAAITALEGAAHRADVVPLLVETLGHSDPELRARADRTLRGLASKPALEAICALALQEPDGTVASLCREQGFKPPDDEKAALFLFATKQLDRYFREYADDHFESLRREYDRADDKLKERVMEVVRAGDVRCLPFIQRPRKTLRDSSEREIKLALQSCLRHSDWAGLFRLCLELPMKYGFPALKHLAQSGWEPEKPDQKALLQQLIRDSEGASQPSVAPPPRTNRVFERWLHEGRSPELTRLSEAELVKRLETATPPEGVPLVSALAAKPDLAPETRILLARNPHWLIRLAAIATGAVKEVVNDHLQQHVIWLNELSTAAGVLEFWPMTATQADLQRLNEAPPQVYEGKLGAVRQALRTLIRFHRGGDIIAEHVVLNFSETDVEIIIEK